MGDESPEAQAGFLDQHRRYRGSASQVLHRTRRLSTLTAIDVVGASKDLAAFLTRLDAMPLTIQQVATGRILFQFRSASGYENGDEIRIQGVLEAR